jgi:hypothetical protein
MTFRLQWKDYLNNRPQRVFNYDFLCFAMNVGRRTILRYLNALHEKGYITRVKTAPGSELIDFSPLLARLEEMEAVVTKRGTVLPEPYYEENDDLLLDAF